MKLYEQYRILTEQNKSLEYEDFFGEIISHDDALKERIRSELSSIIMDELKISEKSFSQIDEVFKTVKDMCEETSIYSETNDLYNNKKRLKYIAEMMYDKYFVNNNSINETMTKAAQKRLDEINNVEEKVIASKKLSQELKDVIIPLIIKGQTRYRNGVVSELKNSISGCGLGADENGFFVFTHRARSKSHPSIDKITQKEINFIKSTG